MPACAGPYEEGDTPHVPCASHSIAQPVLLPGGGSGGRPIGGGLRAAIGVRQRAATEALTSAGRGVVDDRIVQLAKQLTDSGVPLEVATAKAEIQVRAVWLCHLQWPAQVSTLWHDYAL